MASRTEALTPRLSRVETLKVASAETPHERPPQAVSGDSTEALLPCSPTFKRRAVSELKMVLLRAFAKSRSRVCQMTLRGSLEG